MYLPPPVFCSGSGSFRQSTSRSLHEPADMIVTDFGEAATAIGAMLSIVAPRRRTAQRSALSSPWVSILQDCKVPVLSSCTPWAADWSCLFFLLQQPGLRPARAELYNFYYYFLEILPPLRLLLNFFFNLYQNLLPFLTSNLSTISCFDPKFLCAFVDSRWKPSGCYSLNYIIYIFNVSSWSRYIISACYYFQIKHLFWEAVWMSETNSCRAIINLTQKVSWNSVSFRFPLIFVFHITLVLLESSIFYTNC